METVEEKAMERAIEDYLNFLYQERDYSPNTIAAYRNDLEQFAAFVREQAAEKGLQPQWPSLSKELILSYMLSIEEKGYAITTVARKATVVKSFLNFLVNNGTLGQTPIRNISGPRVKRVLPKILSEAEVRELLAQPDKISSPEGQRDKAMLELLYATGMRVSELVSLKLSDVNLEQGVITCSGKEGKQRSFPLPEQVIIALRNYLEQARPRLFGEQQTEVLFLNRRGQGISRQGFWLKLKKYAQMTGIETDITPHTLRHSVAVRLLESGEKDLKGLQEFLGHSNIITTQIYSRLVSELHPNKTGKDVKIR